MISSDAVRRDDRGASRARTATPTVARVAMGLACLALACLALAACAAGIKRDLSAVPVGQVGFDDLCGLQSYFDAIATKSETAPEIIDAADIEGQSRSGLRRGGRARFAFETDFQLAAVRRVLDENWKDLPSRLGVAHRIEINVNWSERAGVRRVANNSAPELLVDGVAASLPYHVCLSELLFGEPLYQQRREMLDPAAQPTAHPLAHEPEPHTDAGAPDGRAPLSARATSSPAVTPSPSPSAAPVSGTSAAGGPAEAPSPKTESPKAAPTKTAPGAHPTVTGKKD